MARCIGITLVLSVTALVGAPTSVQGQEVPPLQISPYRAFELGRLEIDTHALPVALDIQTFEAEADGLEQAWQPLTGYLDMVHAPVVGDQQRSTLVLAQDVGDATSHGHRSAALVEPVGALHAPLRDDHQHGFGPGV